MKNGQIFARKSTARGGLDLEYLDETSRRKISLRKRENMDQQIGKKLKHFTDYASKETLGQVHVGGFFHNHICINPDGTNTAPSKRTPFHPRLAKEALPAQAAIPHGAQTLLAPVRLHRLFASQRPHAAPGTGAVGRRMKWEW
ncbi:MAG TPA: hypothetical protein VIT23_06550 [Terrimicrobiaceae bacterium]